MRGGRWQASCAVAPRSKAGEELRVTRYAPFSVLSPARAQAGGIKLYAGGQKDRGIVQAQQVGEDDVVCLCLLAPAF